MADAGDLKSPVLMDVRVQVPPPVLHSKKREVNMLVLERAEGEAVVITVPPSSNAIKIRVLTMKVKGCNSTAKVKEGFDAPHEVQFRREELEDKPRSHDVALKK